MTVKEALELMTDEAKEKLHEFVSQPDEIDISKKVGNDIIMGALCEAVNNGTISPKSLNQKIIKLLNSDTNSISDLKLDEILKTIHKSQPDIACVITTHGKVIDALTDEPRESTTKYVLYENFLYTGIFAHVVSKFEITPQMVRSKLSETLKMTIVNNVSQLVSKFLTMKDDPDKLDTLRVSITSITRLVNMMGHTIIAEFKSVPEEDRVTEKGAVKLIIY